MKKQILAIKRTSIIATLCLVVIRAVADCPEGQQQPNCDVEHSGDVAKVTCDCGQVACCILGTDKNGQDYNIATCCTGGKQCLIKYADGSSSGGGLINIHLGVSKAGCQ